MPVLYYYNESDKNFIDKIPFCEKLSLKAGQRRALDCFLRINVDQSVFFRRLQEEANLFFDLNAFSILDFNAIKNKKTSFISSNFTSELNIQTPVEKKYEIEISIEKLSGNTFELLTNISIISTCPISKLLSIFFPVLTNESSFQNYEIHYFDKYGSCLDDLFSNKTVIDLLLLKIKYISVGVIILRLFWKKLTFTSDLNIKDLEKNLYKISVKNPRSLCLLCKQNLAYYKIDGSLFLLEEACLICNKCYVMFVSVIDDDIIITNLVNETETDSY